MSAHWRSTGLQCCFPSCHTIAFQRIWILWASSHSSWDFQTSRTGWEASGFFFLPFLPWREREESPIFKSTLFISHTSLHVSKPCFNSFLLRLLPRSRSTAPGLFPFPTARHNLHYSELHGSRLTCVIWRYNRLFFSAAEMASRFVTHMRSECSQSGRTSLKMVYMWAAAACLKQTDMKCLWSKNVEFV